MGALGGMVLLAHVERALLNLQTLDFPGILHLP